MEDRSLNQEWRKEIDQAVKVALLLGDRVSLGGFSTGGVLSLNKVLQDPETIKGGLFLFSAALDLGFFIEELSRNGIIRFFMQSYLKLKDGVVAGTGFNPYKFPRVPKFAGLELGQIINENEDLVKDLETAGQKISNPVFAAHSVHATRVKIAGLLEVFQHHVKEGLACIISENVTHEELVLAEDIPVNMSHKLKEYRKGKNLPNPNPRFDWMMDNAVYFFKKYVIKN